jgi:hypothetical protein
MTDLFTVRADAPQTRIRDLLKAREAPLIFRKNEAERSCAGASSQAVQLAEGPMSVLVLEGTKDLRYMADQKKDPPYTADRKVQSECGAKVGLRGAGQPAAHQEPEPGRWTRTLETGVKSGIEY